MSARNVPELNAVYQAVDTDGLIDGRYRVLQWAEGSDEIHLFFLEAKRGVPLKFSFGKFKTACTTLKILPAQFPLPYYLSASPDDWSATDRELLAVRWKLIEDLVKPESGIFDPDLRGRMVREQAIRAGTPSCRIYDLLRLYWRYGLGSRSLFPATSNRGGKGLARIPGIAKRGRPSDVVRTRHNTSLIGVNTTPRDRANIEMAVSTFYIGANRTLRDAYELMIDSSYSRTIEEEGLITHIPLPAHEVIRETAFRYEAEKLLKQTEWIEKKLGTMRFNQIAKGRPGKVTDQTRVSAHTYEIDANLTNVWLVSQFNRRRLIGKPVIYFVPDRGSQMITGMHTALEGPSWNAARFALYWAMTDKVEYCAGYGVEIKFEDWPCNHQPRQVTSDSGEMLSKAARDSLRHGMDIISNINAFGAPQNKAIVESRFEFVGGKVEWVPGGYRHSAKRWREETGRDPRFDAVLTLSEFTAILIREVLFHNNYQPAPHLLTAQMRRDGVKPFRRDIYLWGIEHSRFSRPKIPDPTALYVTLLPKAKASVADHGIIFKGRRYIPEDDDARLILAAARLNRVQVEVHWDPNTPKRIWVSEIDKRTRSRWKLSPSDQVEWEYARFEEVEHHQQCDALLARENEDEIRIARAKVRQENAATVATAKGEVAKTPPLATKTAKTSGVRANRAVERSKTNETNISPEFKPEETTSVATTPKNTETEPALPKNNVSSIQEAAERRRLAHVQRLNESRIKK